jgi:hypothetical protein
MAELTIQISDELAKQLEPLRHRLPELLSQLVGEGITTSAPLVMATAHLPSIPQAYLEVLDFLVTCPTPQDRLSTLLEKNREGNLTASEVAELDVYEQLEHLMILMKARAASATRTS